MRLEDYLEKSAARKNFRKGESVFEEGAQADAAYYIISGQVEIFKKSGASGVVASLREGEIFGEMALLRFDRYTLSARAAEDTEVFVVTPAMLQEQVRATHPLIRAILGMLVERIHGVNEVLIDLDSTTRQA